MTRPADLRLIRALHLWLAVSRMRVRRTMLALCVLLGVPGGAWARDALTIGVSQFPPNFHPDIDPALVKQYVLDFTTRPITAFDKDWKLVCLLCTELPTIENGLAAFETHDDGSRGMAVTIKLKPDLFWGDGVPVTAKDIAFTWKVGHDPGSGVAEPHAWGQVNRVEVVDDRTAILHLDAAAYDYNRWGTILPEHLEAASFAAAKAPGDYTNQSLYNRAPATAGLYNGPYRIAQVQSGAQIVLEPNLHWKGAKPGFQRIVIRTIENTAALQANLLSGDIDMAPGEGIGLSINQVVALQKDHPDQFGYLFLPSLNYEHLDVQASNPILADVRVRQALLLAIDRTAIVEKLFGGRQPVAATWVNPLEAGYSPDAPTYGFDPARARALLADAGWKPGDDGILRDKTGQRLSIEMSTTAGNRLREVQEQVLQSQWKSVGIETIIRNEPARTLFGETLKRRTFAGLVMYAWSSAVGASPRNMLGSDQIPSAANGWSGANYVGYSSKDMDADIARAEAELDPAKQKPIWASMQKRYAEELPVLPLFFRSEAHVIPPWLKGYAPTGNSSYGSLWAENWRD